MGQMVNVKDLIGASEVAEIIGLSHHNSVSTYMQRYDDFPAPVIAKSNGRIRLWLRSEIEKWNYEHG
jgi:predicted DNA-binding transcriptional regulator AlpA